ncbi:hypothetical protein HMI54_009569 [Coelomomyces lativittatus]|nr:hypothetical protein HMI54_009569 [Coelomomyces lativittatus]KAJ1502189.1 hypothetical protein HMI56_002820 [Coelomomyces lativittatus]KAJ1506284.1 hypothetical protein HMI55_001241 [Coelomomyces lativittatus]
MFQNLRDQYDFVKSYVPRGEEFIFEQVQKVRSANANPSNPLSEFDSTTRPKLSQYLIYNPKATKCKEKSSISLPKNKKLTYFDFLVYHSLRLVAHNHVLGYWSSRERNCNVSEEKFSALNCIIYDNEKYQNDLTKINIWTDERKNQQDTVRFPSDD